MKVLIISTAERTGGGAIAARRLMTALDRNGIDTRMLVRDKQGDDPMVIARGSKWAKALERLRLMIALRMPYRRTWNYDLALDGIDITSTQEYREADVVHLHWINQGMLSLGQLHRMLSSGKRIVWTLHDEWPFRGIMHYTGIGMESGNSRVMALERKHFARKQDIYRQGQLHFVGCSRWIAGLAREAMPQAMVHHVNNCVPHDIFHPQDRQQARETLHLPQDERTILFTCQNIGDARKGFSYLIEALEHLPSPKPHLVVVGGKPGEALSSVKGVPPDHIHFIPYVNGEQAMARLYAAVDCFVTPSLQDNLPNTIAEAMSCGTPCVGFDTGGIPEMISHMHDGYVARYLDSHDLAQGIMQVLNHPEWRDAAAQTAAHDYSEERVARQYTRIYQGLEERGNRDNT